MRIYKARDLDQIPQLRQLSPEDLFAMNVVAQVLPFRTNNYVINELIDWSNIPEDPIYQLNFIQKEMLRPNHFEQMAKVLKYGASKDAITAIANRIRSQLNPNPAGQMTANVPIMDSEPVAGIQHKYRETCLVFPAGGQTCHAYCTFCFRWPQFIGVNNLQFITDESRRFQDYIRCHPEITDVLFTGGDPLIMSTEKMRSYIHPFLDPDFDHIQTIRIGTKAISYWPYRFISDNDAEDLMVLFEEVVSSGKHLALMAHFNHWREFSTEASQTAIKLIRNTGAELRTQSPLLRHINDDARIWRKMWKEQIRLGCIPYYMFIERDTGTNTYFALPLERAFRVFKAAYTRLSGLARVVCGPSMSANPGKICIEGIATIDGEKVFVLTFLQGRDPDWCKRPFFAKFDPSAKWLDDLEPALGAEKFFFEKDPSNEIHDSLVDTHRVDWATQER